MTRKDFTDLNKGYSRPRRYVSSAFYAFSYVAEILSSHAPIMAGILLVTGLLGMAISLPLGIALAVGIGIVMLATAIITFVMHSQKVKNINDYIKCKEDACQEVADLQKKVELAEVKQQQLIKQAKDLDLDIKSILAIQERAREESEKKLADSKASYNIAENNQTLIGMIKNKIAKKTTAMKSTLTTLMERLHLETAIPILYKIGIGIITVCVAVAAAGGIVAGIAAFTGANVFQLGLIPAFTAATGLSGPIGIAIIVGIAATLIALLLINKFYFERSVDKAESNMKNDKLQHKLEHLQAEAALERTERANLNLLTKINEKLHQDRQGVLVRRWAVEPLGVIDDGEPNSSPRQAVNGSPFVTEGIVSPRLPLLGQSESTAESASSPYNRQELR
jgi:hypothetical protein